MMSIKTRKLFNALKSGDHEILNNNFFDTLSIRLKGDISEIKTRLLDAKININWFDNNLVSISIDEATTSDDIADLVFALSGKPISNDFENGEAES